MKAYVIYEPKNTLLAVAATLEAAKKWTINHLLTEIAPRHADARPGTTRVEEIKENNKTTMALKWTVDTRHKVIPSYERDYRVYIDSVDFAE